MLHKGQDNTWYFDTNLISFFIWSLNESSAEYLAIWTKELVLIYSTEQRRMGLKLA